MLGTAIWAKNSGRERSSPAPSVEGRFFPVIAGSPLSLPNLGLKGWRSWLRKLDTCKEGYVYVCIYIYVCMYIHTYIYTYIYIYIYLFIYLFIEMRVYVYTCTWCVCLYMHICICAHGVCIYIYVCMWICIYIYVYVFMYICICFYVHVFVYISLHPRKQVYIVNMKS